MREIKTFFNQNNSLNKGYASEIESFNNDENNIIRRKIAQNLPSADLMSVYEEMHPGTFEKLLKTLEKEQTHRHNVELVNIQMHARASVMGRLFGFFVVCTISYVALKLAMNDMVLAALAFALIGFASIFGVSLIAYSRTSNRSFYDKRRAGGDRNNYNSRVNSHAPKDSEAPDSNKPRNNQQNASKRRRR